jgi:hypothetical protein
MGKIERMCFRRILIKCDSEARPRNRLKLGLCAIAVWECWGAIAKRDLGIVVWGCWKCDYDFLSESG